ncbi:hypothetical protein [Pseudomonas gingeri]|uniref:Uncharacterized protein n=1 Tax=Pseudomonas gingeri TaxID=117681 RepID=A0A7Y7Y6E1_9PSED|nr:hypothetical protein [Pseudomonas gingeri]NWC18691.1 hypothetical protein [Pseudomonas gingeri]
MKPIRSSELRRWLELQESVHGDLYIGCMTAFGNTAEGGPLTYEELTVTLPRMLPILIDGVDPEAKVIAIGCGKETRKDCEFSVDGGQV